MVWFFCPRSGLRAVVRGVCGAALLSCAGPSGPPPLAVPDAALPARVWLRVDTPRERSLVELETAFVEVSGRAGSEGLEGYDIVIALDFSESSLQPSGIDVDGDGTVAERRHSDNKPSSARPGRIWDVHSQRLTTDPDDTAFAAQRHVARVLISSLHESNTRVGLLTFSGKPVVHAHVGSPDEALRALDQITMPRRADPTGSNLSKAMDRAGELLDEATSLRGPTRPKAILIFSDGIATGPENPYLADRVALASAKKLAEQRMVVYGFGFGEEVLEDAGSLPEIVTLTEGGLKLFADRESLAMPLRESAALLRVDIRNHASGGQSRAQRVFGDGSFDAFVELEPGWNSIDVVAHFGNGAQVREQRRVFYRRPETPTSEQKREAARTLVELRRRTVEIENHPEAARAATRRKKEVVVRSTPDPQE
jgi:hypothetical protein